MPQLSDKAKADAGMRRSDLMELTLTQGITSKAELREAAKSAGIYTSEGSFGRDLTQARKEFGRDVPELFFTGQGNNGGGRRSLEINGAKYNLKKIKPSEIEPGKLYVKKKGETYEPFYSTKGGDPQFGKYPKPKNDDPPPDDENTDEDDDPPKYMSDDDHYQDEFDYYRTY